MDAQHQPPTEDANVAPRATETAGSGIEERIGQVLLAHLNTPFGRCVCGHEFPGGIDDCDGWAAHVAAVLVAELGLTEQWCARHESGGGGIYRDHDDASRFLDGFIERPPAVEDPGSGRYTGLERRYVTGWEPA